MGKYRQLWIALGIITIVLIGFHVKQADAALTYDQTTNTLTLNAPVGEWVWVGATSTVQSLYDETTFQQTFPSGIDTPPNGQGCIGGSTCPVSFTGSTSPQYIMVKYTTGSTYTDTAVATEFYTIETGVFTDLNHRTHFISVSPSYGSNVATGTVTITVTGYITSEDLAKANGHMQFSSIANQVDPVTKNPSIVTAVDLTSSGNFTVVGTSSIDYASIWNDTFTLATNDSPNWWNKLSNAGYIPSGLQGGATIFVSTSTYFAIGNLSPFQQQLFEQTKNRHAFVSSTTAAYDLSSCSPIATSSNALGMTFNGGFNPQTCIYNLVIPSGDGMKEISDEAQSGFLSAAPWGYIARMVDLVNSGTSTDATTTIPALSYTFPASMPVFGSTTISVDIYSALVQAADLENHTFVSSTDGKTLWQVFEPLVNLFFAIVILMKIISDITGLDFSVEAAQDTKVGGAVPDGTYRYKEKLYSMSKRK
jgi:hypothetical protein